MSQKNSSPRRLILDIETAPALAEVWQLWDVNIGLSQVVRDPYLLCFAAKWYGEKEVKYYDSRDFDHMVYSAHALLDEADVVIHFNGKRFDIPHLQREFLLMGLTPPSPFKQVDLYQASKQQFKWLSNKLEYVATQLGVGSKLKHTGHELWTRCIDGDEKAWDLMKKYNVQDVRLTERVYDALIPWIPGMPHVGLWVDSSDPMCPRCGSRRIQRRGNQPAAAQVYQRYQCQDCGGWSRGVKVESRANHTRLI